MTKKLTIYSKEKKTTDGKAFLVYSYVKNDKWYDVRFTKKCSLRPIEKGYIDIEVEDKDISVQTKKFDDKVKNILWINRLVSYSVNIEKNDELAKRKADAIAELFD